MLTAITREALLKDQADTQPARPRKPKALPLDTIVEVPAVFQPREAMDDTHVEGIAQGIGGDTDDPVEVWWSGQRWVLLDGHHRLAAYRIKASGTESLRVPVKVFAGVSLAEAERRSIAANSRDKLNMRNADKIAAAWRLVCRENGSKKEQHEASSASKATIGNMRAAYRRLTERRRIPAEQLEAMGWERARELDRGKPEKDHSPNALEAMAQEMAMKLSGTFKDTLTKCPEVFARAVQIYSPALVESLITSDPWWDVLDTTGRAALKESDEWDRLDAMEVEDF